MSGVSQRRSQTWASGVFDAIVGTTHTLYPNKIAGGGSAYYLYAEWTGTGANITVEFLWGPVNEKLDKAGIYTHQSFSTAQTMTLTSGTGTNGMSQALFFPPWMSIKIDGTQANMRLIDVMVLTECG